MTALNIAVEARKALWDGVMSLQSAGASGFPSSITSEASVKNENSRHFLAFGSSHDDVAGSLLTAPATKIELDNTTVEGMLSAEILAPIVKLPSSSPGIRASFDLLQQWECTVLTVGMKDFTAIARDCTTPNRPDEEVTFDLEDVNDGNRSLLVPGAVFYWNVGYRISEWGQKTKGSELRFRRLPAWGKRDLDAAKARASRLRSLFSDNDSR
jgi:hypothetical protein